MAKQSFKSKIEGLLGKRRRGISVKWDPTHRGVVETSHREIRKALGRGRKDDVHGYTFWDVSTDDFDSDFAPDGECIQLSNRDYRISSLVNQPEQIHKNTSDRDVWFVMASSPKAIRALADEVDGFAHGIEEVDAPDKNKKPKKLTAAETKARKKAEGTFIKKMEKLGYKARVNHLRGRGLTVKGKSNTYQKFDGVEGIWFAAWESGLFRFYYSSNWTTEDVEDIKVTFREASPIPSKYWKLEKRYAGENAYRDQSPRVKVREWYHHQ